MRMDIDAIPNMADICSASPWIGRIAARLVKVEMAAAVAWHVSSYRYGALAAVIVQTSDSDAYGYRCKAYHHRFTLLRLELDISLLGSLQAKWLLL
jgi:hypothetical protein